MANTNHEVETPSAGARKIAAEATTIKNNPNKG